MRGGFPPAAFLRQCRFHHAPHVGPAQPHEVRAGKFSRKCVAQQYAGCLARQIFSLRQTRVRQRPGRHIKREPVREVG